MLTYIYTTFRNLGNIIGQFSKTSKILFSILLIVFLSSLTVIISIIDNRVSIVVPSYGGNIYEGVIGAPKIINPLLDTTGTTRDISGLVFSGLFEINQNNEISPALAESFSIVPDKPRTYDIVIRRNALFHDGSRVTAEDVQFTYSLVTNPLIKSPLASTYAGTVVEVLNPQTVRITFPSTRNHLHLGTLGILPKNIYSEVPAADFGLVEYHTNPVGAGPFRIHSLRRDSVGIPVSLTLSRFNEYALGKPYIKYLHFNFYKNEQELLSAYRAGDVDSVGGLSPKNAALIVKENSQTQYDIYALPRVFAVFFNQNKNKALQDPVVRKALYDSAPRNAIVSNILEGFGIPAFSPLPQKFLTQINDGQQSIIENQVSTTSADTLDHNTVNTADIEQELDKAGYVRGEDGYRVKKNKTENIPLTITISTANTPDLQAIAQVLKETWGGMGVQVQLAMFDPNDLNQNVIKKRDYEALLFGEVIHEEDDLYAFWHSSRRADPGLNVALYSNPRVDTALEALNASSSMQVADRNIRLRAVEVEIQRDTPAVFLYSPSYIYISPLRYTEAQMQSIDSPTDRLRYIYRGYLKTEQIWPVFKNILEIL